MVSSRVCHFRVGLIRAKSSIFQEEALLSLSLSLARSHARTMHGRDQELPVAPAFTTARAMVDVGDDDESDGDSGHFAPHYVPGDAGASDDELDGVTPAPHRDSHAAFVFAPAEPRGADALNQWMEPGVAKPDFSALLFHGKSAQSDRRAVFIPFAKTQPVPEESDVPLKDFSVFSDADHTFRCTSGHSPAKIMHTIKSALQYFDAVEVKEDAQQWRLDVSCLCVAEQIDFTIRLMRFGDDGSTGDRKNFEVGFHHTSGDEARFLPLMECIRTRCREIDDEALLLLPFLDDTLEPWMDARQEITGRDAAIGAKDALELIKQLHADLHAKTLFEVAKEIKDHCRHKSSRTTFHRVDPKNFLTGIKGMLSSGSLDMSRFGVFILLQFAKDHDVRDRNDAFSPFFHSPYEKSSFAVLLNGVLEKHQKAACGAFTAEMVRRVQRSWLFV